MTHAIRAMEAGDLAAVERIFRAHASGDAPRGRRRQLRDRVAEVLGADAHERAVALVAADARGKVAGYLVGDVRSWEFGSAPAGWIFALGVDPKAERQGLGSELLAAAVEAFRARGIGTVRTRVRRDDVPTLRFFRSGGFAAGPYVEMELARGAR